MAKLFVTDRELSFFSDITKEIIKDIAGQTIIYHAISEDKSIIDSLYGEAKDKISDKAIEIECLVNWQGSETTTTSFGIDKIFSLEVYFHTDDLEDKNIKIREGDFIEFEGHMFEINKLSQPDLIYGMGHHKTMIKAECKSARKGQYYIENMESTTEEKTFTQVAGDINQGDIRVLVDSGKVERILDNPGVTSPFNEDSDY